MLLLIALIFASANSVADDLFDMLQNISDIEKKESYKGVFVLRKSDQLSTIHISHGFDEQGVWERLESLNGKKKKVLRYNNRIISVYPNRKLVTLRQTKQPHSLHLQLPNNIEQLKSVYTVSRLNDDRIANHQSFVLDLIPKDKYRYGYRYWIDKKTGVLLRCDLLSEKGNIIEQMMFTSFEYLDDDSSNRFDKEQFERLSQQVTKATAKVEQTLPTVNWKIQMLPKGFVLTKNAMRLMRVPNSEASLNKAVEPDIQHLVYSDGLASVSVFIEENKGNKPNVVGASSRGTVNAYGYLKDNYFVTVVGEVPKETVQLMAQSVAKKP